MSFCESDNSYTFREVHRVAGFMYIYCCSSLFYLQVNEKFFKLERGWHKKKADKIEMGYTHNRVIHTTHMNSQPK